MNDVIQAHFLDALYVGRPADLAEAQQEAFRRQADRIATRKEKADAEKMDTGDLVAVAIVSNATAEQVRRLSVRTDLHQQLVIEALQENREALDQSQEALDALLEEAHMLEDGRRVFESRDGTRVVDEFGQVVAPSIVRPEEIEDWRPDAETYLERRDAHMALIREQRELLEYQQELDRMDQQIASGNLSQEELQRMETFMDDNAPAAIRAKLPETDPASRRLSGSTEMVDPSRTNAAASPIATNAFDPSTLFK
ncbi:MAG: hypothetical protein AAGI03_03090 [Pseudomonadota bacterium]